MLFLFFAVFGLYELYGMIRQKEKNAPRWFMGMSIGAVLYLLIFLIATETIDLNWLWILALLIPLMFCFELIKLDSLTVSNTAITIFGWVYVILPFALINILPVTRGSYEYELPVGFFLILWANDTGAYFTGKYFGKRKLFPKVSPNKTWEGLFGGILISFIGAWILYNYFESIELHHWIMMAFIVSVFGNLGDLFESHIKRTFGMKDSGTIIPGHGGVLDRFDGLLLALPVTICYFKLISFL